MHSWRTDRRRMSLPIAPVMATVFLLLIAGYWFRLRMPPGSPGIPSPMAQSPDVLRVISWDLGGDSTAESTRSEDLWASIADIFAAASPQVVALQNVPDESTAERIARGLGEGWRAISVRQSTAVADGLLAFLIHPRVPVVDRRLLPTGVEDEALAVTLCGPLARHVRLVCVRAAPDDGPRRRTYLERVLSWSVGYADDTLAVVGAFGGNRIGQPADDANVALFDRFTQRFTLATAHGSDPRGEGADFSHAIFFSSPTLRLISARELPTPRRLPHPARPPLMVEFGARR